MLIPLPLPDEFARGHIGRIQILNETTNYAQTTAAIRREAARASGKEHQRSLIDALAILSKMPSANYVCLHSFIPYSSCAIASAKGAWDDKIQIRMGTTTPQATAHFCEKCVEEDIGFHGFSYWRRVHQLPGMMWCPKHLNPLMRSVSENPFAQMPVEHVATALPCSTEGYETLPRTPLSIQRYLEAAMLLMDQQRPFNRLDVKRRLSARAQAMGMRVSEAGRRPLLSDVVLKKFPLEWLRTIFPAIEEKREGTFFSAIDYVVRTAGTAPSTEAICIAISLLFEQPENGIGYLLDSAPDPHCDAHSALAYEVKPSLGDVFTACGGSLKRIEAMLCVEENSGLAILSRRLPELLRDLSGKPEAEALQAFVAGDSLARACSISGASIDSVSLLLRIFVTAKVTRGIVRGRETIGI